MESTKQSSLMSEGNITKHIIFFAIPLILSNLLQQLYNTADSIIVGQFVGSHALAATSSSTAMINLLISFSQGIAIGAGVLVSQYLGANQKESIRETISTSIIIALILGLSLSLVGILCTKQLLLWMNTPTEILNDSSTYLMLYFLGLSFNIMYNMTSGLFNALGKSQLSLYYLGFASITNIVLDLFFIIGLKSGIVGAAIATDISQCLSCILAFHHLTNPQHDYHIQLKKLSYQKSIATKMIQIGLPTAIQNMLISLSNLLVQSSVNQFGTQVVAAFGVYMKIDGFNILPITSLSLAMTTFTGQNYGAKKYDRIIKGTKITLTLSILYTALTGILLLTFSHPLLSLFTNDQTVIQCGQLAMQYFCPFYFILAIMHSLAGSVRGAGKTIPPMIILFISLCLFRMVWLLFVLPNHHTITTIYILYPISWSLGAILMMIYTKKSQWLKERSL